MKTLRYLATALILIALLIKLSSCNLDGFLNASEFTKTMTGRTWKIKSVTVDDKDRTGSLFKGMTLEFKGEIDKDLGTPKDQTFETTNGLPVWPETGTWSYQNTSLENDYFNTDVKEIEIKENGLIMEVEYDKDGTLTFAFDWAQPSTYGGRVASIKGKHVMVFE